MKLKDDFFRVTGTNKTATGADYTVELNPEHFIYQAHFPGNPVTPGVCIIQIVKELTEELLQAPLFLKIVKNAKFTQVINPLQNREVIFAVSVSQENEGDCRVNACVESNGVSFAKLSIFFATNSRK